jgi:chromosomal replication initiation ATPase DnaA
MEVSAMREGDRTLDDVLDAVAAHFEVSREELISGRTSREARRVAMYLALHVTTLSFAQVAKRVGGISWQNVVVGARTIEHRMAEDAKFAAEVEHIKASLVAGGTGGVPKTSE